MTNTIDPLGGAYFVEALTDRMEERCYEYFAKIDALGGMVEAVKRGFSQREIADAAFVLQQEIDSGRRRGRRRRSHRRRRTGPEILRIDPALERKQIERVRAVRANRDGSAGESVLSGLKVAAAQQRNPDAAARRRRPASTPPSARSSRRSRRSGATTASSRCSEAWAASATEHGTRTHPGRAVDLGEPNPPRPRRLAWPSLAAELQHYLVHLA